VKSTFDDPRLFFDIDLTQQGVVIRQDHLVMKKNRLSPLIVCGSLLGFPASMLAQNNDPFAGGAEADPPVLPEKAPETPLKFVYEVFSLPMTKAAELQRAKLADSEFYGKLVGGLKDKSVKQETFLIVRGLPGRRVSVEETKDYIYPTEFDPPELPNMVAGQRQKDQEEGKTMRIFPVTPANPTSYEIETLGDSSEVEAALSGDLINVRLGPSRVTLIQKDISGQGLAKTVMPRFARPRIQTVIFSRSGKPAYLGTVSAPEELQPKDGEQRVFFAFVTTTKLK
jgi:hypothetical protein